MPHIHEQYDFVVVVFIVRDDAVLFVRHPRYNKWLPIGGHIELNEDPNEALDREILEETGLRSVRILGNNSPSLDKVKVKPLLTPRYMEVHEANPPHRHISMVYFAVAGEHDEPQLSAEHTAMVWLGREQLHDPRYDLSRSDIFYAEQAIDAAMKLKTHQA